MAQEQLVLRKIDWHETLPLTRLFGGFRSTLHSTKIVIALAAVFLTFLVGCTLDWIWVKAGRGVLPNEVGYYANAIAADDAGVIARLQTAVAGVPDESPPAVVPPTRRVGPFIALYNFQRRMLMNLVISAAQFRITGGMAGLMASQGGAQLFEPPGVVASTVLMWSGIVWMLREHWFYSLIFVPIALAIWAVAGGAISRAAVLQFAKDERIGIREALRFSLSKFWGFFFAPVVCLLFVVAIGLMLTVGGLLANIPIFGDILVGLLWGLALLGGLAIAFIAIGTLAGGSLFAPVVAAEGSDAFDAISRGFVYVYSRPWKSLLYGLTLVIYGSLCYLFLRLFVWVMLAATHAFVGLGVFRAAHAGGSLDRLDAAWHMPTFLNLLPRWAGYANLGAGETILGLLIGVWTLVVWGLLQSWLIAYYFSGSSMAYLLLRKDVDAIEVDEIYVEEQTEPEAAAPSEPAAGQAAANPAAAGQAAAAEPPSPGPGPTTT